MHVLRDDRHEALGIEMQPPARRVRQGLGLDAGFGARLGCLFLGGQRRQLVTGEIAEEASWRPHVAGWSERVHLVEERVVFTVAADAPQPQKVPGGGALVP